MSYSLTDNSYGKAEVRLLFVDRSAQSHIVRDLTVTITLRGAFERAYTDGDNTTTLSTDAIKNTVYALASDQLRGGSREQFSGALGDRLLAAVPAAEEADVWVKEAGWTRLASGGEPWGHAFEAGASEGALGGATVSREGRTRSWGGWTDIRLLKTTGSAFAGFHRDDYTTMADIADRVLAPVLAVRWSWSPQCATHDATRSLVRSVLVDAFARHEESRSAQHSLYVMARAALDECPDIDEVTIRWPGRLHQPVDLTVFGQENRGEVYVPIDQTPGFVEATLARTG
jgi:urate oxidase